MLGRGLLVALVLLGTAAGQAAPTFRLDGSAFVTASPDEPGRILLYAHHACDKGLVDVTAAAEPSTLGLSFQQTQPWGPCVGREQMANVTFALPAAGDLPAGTHTVTFHATARTLPDGASQARPFPVTVDVPFVASARLDGKAPEAFPAGEGTRLALTLSLAANADAWVDVEVHAPAGWDAKHEGTFPHARGAPPRDLDVVLTPDATAERGDVVVLATVRPADGQAPAVAAKWSGPVALAAAPPVPDPTPDEGGAGSHGAFAGVVALLADADPVLVASVAVSLAAAAASWAGVRRFLRLRRARREVPESPLLSDAPPARYGSEPPAEPLDAPPEAPPEPVHAQEAPPEPESPPPEPAPYGGARPSMVAGSAGIPPPAPAAPPPPSPAPAAAPASAPRPRADRRRSVKKGPAGPPSPPPRHVNVHLARPGGPPLARDTDLAAGASYALRVDIGELSVRSVVENARALREDLLPPPDDEGGHWLEVGAASDDFAVESPLRRLYLPARGPAWSCACREGAPHACAPGERAPFVEFTVRAPATPCEATLRLVVYCRNNAVQSQLLRARVAPVEQRGEGHRARIDYELGRALTAVAALKPRDLSILTNDNPSGTHRVLLKGDAGEFASFSLADDRVRTAAETVRRKLFSIHAEAGPDGEPRSLLDASNAKTRAALEKDLLELARLGWTLHHAIFDHPGKQKVAFQKLRGSGATIQVSRAQTAHMAFPWAALYDLDPAVPPTQVCRAVREWTEGAPLVERGQMRCRHHDEHAPGTACPFGFWGFRHHVEQPPSTEAPRGRMPTSATAPRVVVGLHDGLAATKDWEAHERDLAHLFPGPALRKARTVAELHQALGQDELEVVYFYCHGKRDEVDPMLLVGSDEPLPASFVSGWSVGWYDEPPRHWARTSPLVFLNGCRTLDMRPEDVAGFVGAFAKANAAGVLGTEIPIVQGLANEVAREFLAAFAAAPPGARLPAGVALAHARTALLAKGNLLGLAYTLYGSTDLELVPP